MNLSKYDIQKQEAPPRFNDWSESLPVAVLSDALKVVGKEHGISLRVDDDARPTLCFVPGLKVDDCGSGRWSVANQATEHFLAATEDLKELISTGKITLPPCPRRKQQ